MSAWHELARLDAQLARLSRAESALRLRLGQVLEVLGRGGHFELGFSSLAAYSLERCDRSVRWVEAARCLARRLEALPELRRAVAVGAISWSMGEVLVRVAQADNESAWLEAAQGCTVREMRARVSAGNGSADDVDALLSDDDDETCALRCTLDREEAWLFEATLRLLEQLGESGDDARVEALLAEGQNTLLHALPHGAIDPDVWMTRDADQARWSEQLARWRSRVEALCEEGFRQRSSLDEGTRGGRDKPEDVMLEAAAMGCGSLAIMSSSELDRAVRDLSSRLAQHELVLARHILRLHRSDGWRRLGYATEAQYARERVGMSRSSFLARRSLAERLEGLPRVTEALGTARIGVEAALQVVRVATTRTEVAWVARAELRTLKHLREEVAAALVAVRFSGERDCPPPAEVEMTAFQELERAVVGGGVRECGMDVSKNEDAQRAVEVAAATEAGATKNQRVTGGGWVNSDARMTAQACTDQACTDQACTDQACTARSESTAEAKDSAPRRAWRVMLAGLGRWLSEGVQVSAAHAASPRREVASAGRVELRLWVSRSTRAWWHGLAAQARRWLPRGVGWVKFLCLSLWRTWRHALGADMAYGQIYIRDCFRCTSPVCNRRDVTPHHLQFRSAGGSDEDGNVVAVCTWCHLFGVHGGRIRARGTAARIDWELGPRDRPCVVVHGRERVAA